MLVNINVNGKKIQQEIEPDLPLLDFLRANGCYSVKRGCETSNCAARADGSSVTTLEGLQEEAEEFVAFIADQGAEQCGFCNPGFVMNAIALFRENPQPDENEIKEYLSGNLCRCSGYEGQLRGILNFLGWKNTKELKGKEEASCVK